MENKENLSLDIAYLRHLIKFNTISDDEIITMASTGGGLDAAEALDLFLERDFVQSFNKAIVNLSFSAGTKNYE